MTPIEEVFTELDWDNPDVARAKRDERIEELQATGLVCTAEDLYRINDGRRVFMLTASRPDPISDSSDDSDTSSRGSYRTRPQRRTDSQPRRRDLSEQGRTNRPPTYETR
ncbi:hypothetical protein [Myxacorys almedinensis]|uniref:Uncharacterized protein n=1 Tax=Myxacorys almedinensis A TaxID=2690445 RepID=A0A8J7Z2P9_9CYAN|nr:hypothetical protein [Myxacorys almedinensis]NDJ18914.1 hypothetical protein [Myxacorys almedinensis A]